MVMLHILQPNNLSGKHADYQNYGMGEGVVRQLTADLVRPVIFTFIWFWIFIFDLMYTTFG